VAGQVRQWWPAPALVAGAILAGSLMIEQLFNRMTFQPQPGEPPAGAGLGMPVEDVYFEAGDGVRLHAFYLPRPGSERAVLMFHGNFGNATQRLPFGERLAALDVSVLIPDYRGYGYSEGTPSEAGIYLDAAAAWRYLTDQRGYAADRVVVMGRSLGGAVGIELLTRESAAGLVLISTLRSAREMARSMGLGLLAPLVGSRLDSEGRIPGIGIPLLFFHGDEDEIVPVEHGRTLYDRAQSPKSIHVIPQARHNDIIEVAGDRFWRPLAEFVDAVAPLPSEGSTR
jgi:fermentation-respiration switch protein FrsA (DUF1100 family)